MVRASQALDWGDDGDGDERPRPTWKATPPIKRRPTTFVYFVGGDDGPIKIGYSTNVKNRLAKIQNGCPFRVRVLATVRGSQSDEMVYHLRFAADRLHGEWFARSPELLREIERLIPPAHSP